MSLAGKTLNPGDRVRHQRFGTGTIRLDEGETAVVRFDDGLQECAKADLIAGSRAASGGVRESVALPD